MTFTAWIVNFLDSIIAYLHQCLSLTVFISISHCSLLIKMSALNGKSLGSLKKDALILYIAEQEHRNSELLQNMANEITSLKGEITALRDASTIQSNFSSRIVDVERSIALQEQYSRRECVDIVNIPEEIDDSELEHMVVEIFKSAGVKVNKRDFHAIHRKKGNKTVIAKLVNRRDTIDILRAKGFVRNFSPDIKKHLKLHTDTKIYVNESLCSSFSKLLGISNRLFKKKIIGGFYTVNGLLRLKLIDGSTAAISHVVDLRKLFGDVVDTIIKEHEDERNAKRH